MNTLHLVLAKWRYRDVRERYAYCRSWTANIAHSPTLWPFFNTKYSSFTNTMPIAVHEQSLESFVKRCRTALIGPDNTWWRDGAPWLISPSKWGASAYIRNIVYAVYTHAYKRDPDFLRLGGPGFSVHGPVFNEWKNSINGLTLKR